MVIIFLLAGLAWVWPCGPSLEPWEFLVAGPFWEAPSSPGLEPRGDAHPPKIPSAAETGLSPCCSSGAFASPPGKRGFLASSTALATGSLPPCSQPTPNGGGRASAHPSGQ